MLKSIERIRRELEAKVKAKVQKVPLEKHQEVLDLLREGRTIGEVCISETKS